MSDGFRAAMPYSFASSLSDMNKPGISWSRGTEGPNPFFAALFNESAFPFLLGNHKGSKFLGDIGLQGRRGLVDVASGVPGLSRSDLEVLESDEMIGRDYIVVLRVVIKVDGADATGVTGSGVGKIYIGTSR